VYRLTTSHIGLVLISVMFFAGMQVSCAQAIGRPSIDDSVQVTVVSDTLNASELSVSDWIEDGTGRTLLNSIDETHAYEPYHRMSPVRNDLGNIGSADHTMLFDRTRTPGFHFRSSRRLYWVPLEERTLILSDQMYSRVQYTNGAKRENHLIAEFCRGFGSAVNMGFRFTRINSLGFYDRQRSTVTDFSVFGTISSRNDRYRLAVLFDYRNLKVEENGGIRADSLFENNLTRGRDFIPVNLSQASNHWKGFDIGLEQRFLMSKNDSTQDNDRLRPAISHSFSVNRSGMVYRDVPDTVFYRAVYRDSLSTYDSTRVLDVQNTVRFELVRSGRAVSRAFDRLAVGVRHGFHRVSYDSIWVDEVHNLSVLADLSGSFKGRSTWQIKGQFFPYGFNQWDLRVEGRFEQTVQRSLFRAELMYDLFTPDYITQR